MRFGAEQREGIVLGGWVFKDPASTLPDVTPVRALALSQDASGLLHENSAALLGNVGTNGVGSIVVWDFNGDGYDDLVMLAYNESPFVPKPSVAWISGPGGSLNKQTLADLVENHDARLVTIGGVKKILGRSFGGGGNLANGPGYNPLYTWNGTGFKVDSLGELGGMSVVAGNFAGDGSDWIGIGDAFNGPGITFSPTNPMQNYLYRFSANTIVPGPVSLPKPYFNDKAQYAGFVSAWDPYSKTHTSRLWTTDLNQDGLPDILAGSELWAPGPGLQKAAFQLLINKGNLAFEDQTDALVPEFSQDANIDYSVRLVDIDGSGIDSIFLSASALYDRSQDASKQGQYILVNDGTGRLYAAMHEEFRAMGPQIVAHLSSKLPAGQNAIPGFTPSYYAYRTAAGKINFVALVGIYDPAANGQLFGAVNVPLGIDLSTDFRRNLTVLTRNGSHNIRTFAGDDMIHRAPGDPSCKIDGGGGVNTAVYFGKRADWVITRSGSQVTITPAAGGGVDTLTRIQKARFDDITVDLSSI